jgi:hypothetical protein
MGLGAAVGSGLGLGLGEPTRGRGKARVRWPPPVNIGPDGEEPVPSHSKDHRLAPNEDAHHEQDEGV